MENETHSAAPSTHSSNEKGRTSKEVESTAGVEKTLFNPDIDVSGVDERKLIRKIDLALVPWLSFLYLLSFLDRTSIGNAKVSFAHMRLVR